MATTPRPAGATLLALALGWFAFAGFGNALVWRRMQLGAHAPVSPRWSTAVEALQSPALSALALMSGITACIAAVGVWQLRPWKARAFLAWSTSMVVVSMWFVFALPTAWPASGRVPGTVFVLFLAAVLAVMYLYVARLPRSP